MGTNYASKVINVALAEVGYLEKGSNSNLDSKTGNAGYRNYTKYSRDFDKNYPTFYNGKKSGAEWCDIFVDWCMVKAFGVEAALKLLGQPKKSCGAGCSWSALYYQKIPSFYRYPEVGDQIFFRDGNGSPCHTGIVYKVDSTYVYTIEGNTSDKAGVVANGGCVAKKKYKLNSSSIHGYGRPKYDKEPSKTYSGVFPNITVTYYVKDKKGNKVKKNRHYLKKGDKGTQVAHLQRFLNWYGGYKLDVDGDFGNLTLNAVKGFQDKNKLVVDGLFGKKSLAKAKTIKK